MPWTAGVSGPGLPKGIQLWLAAAYLCTLILQSSQMRLSSASKEHSLQPVFLLQALGMSMHSKPWTLWPLYCRQDPPSGADLSCAPELCLTFHQLVCHLHTLPVLGLECAMLHCATSMREATNSALWVQNVLNTPSEDKFRRVRAEGSAFFRRAGQYQGAADLLQAAGFMQKPAAAGQDAVWVLTRNDPGLLWLVLSAVSNCRRQL